MQVWSALGEVHLLRWSMAQSSLCQYAGTQEFYMLEQRCYSFFFCMQLPIGFFNCLVYSGSILSRNDHIVQLERGGKSNCIPGKQMLRFIG